MIDADTRLLTDENVHPEVVAFLRELGSDVIDVKEQEQMGASDSHIVDLAADARRIILTHDRDFGRLLMAQDRSLPTGVIYLRPGHIDPDFTIGTLEVLIEHERPASPFIVVAKREKDTVRIRTRTIESNR